MNGKRFTLLSLALVGLFAPTANAQYGYGYPGGYGGMGWGGFSAAAGYGQEAAGLGMMASGMGNYNLQTSEARAINVNTNMQLNEYMYESIRQRDARELAARQAKEARTNEGLKQTATRLRDNPTQADIYSGNALNVAITELSDPRYSAMVGQYAAQMKIPGSAIKNIPFNSASAAVTFGLDKLTDAQPGPIFQRAEFTKEVADYRRLGDQLREEAEADGKVKSATVKEFRATIQSAVDKLKALKDVDPAQRSRALTRTKALLGLSYALDGPSIDLFLAELKGDEQIGLDRLLSFLRSFNLRFGIAENPNQKQTYDILYPMLVQLRRDVFGEGTGTLLTDPPRPVDEAALENFYAGMHEDELNPNKKPAPPTPPTPGGQ